MGLDSIWDGDGEYLSKSSKSFRARSTGCDCCSVELDTPEEVRKEALDSLEYIVVACEFFGWDIDRLINKARREYKKRRAKAKK